MKEEAVLFLKGKYIWNSASKYNGLVQQWAYVWVTAGRLG